MKKEKKKQTKYPFLIRFLAKLKRKQTPRKLVGKTVDGPVVYLCRHLDREGLATAIAYIPEVLRPWVLDKFTSYKSIKDLYVNYTFPVRMGKGKTFSAVVGRLAARGTNYAVKKLNGIAVYRGEQSAKTITTIKQSVRALENGDKLLVFPDVDYADKSAGDEQIYKGFGVVDKMFRRKTGKKVSFVPVYIGDDVVVLHKPVYFDGSDDEFYSAIAHGMYHEEELGDGATKSVTACASDGKEENARATDGEKTIPGEARAAGYRAIKPACAAGGVADDVTERTNNGSRNPGNRRKNADTSEGFFDEGDKPRFPEPIKTVRDDSGIITELELSDNPSAI